MTQEKPAKPSKSVGTLVWDFFCSVKLAIFTLILLAITSIAGTVIPQQLSREEYLEKMSESAYNFYSALGLTDVYHVWWFQLLLLILSINLIVCSINRFPYTWRMIVRPTNDLDEDSMFNYQLREKFHSHEAPDVLKARYEELVTKQLGKPDVAVKEDGGFSFFVERGKYARLGVYVVHLSVIIILVGALIGFVWGVRGGVNIPEGKWADTIYLFGTNGTPHSLGFGVRCDDFDVSFYDTGAPKEFKSDLVILENGAEVLKKTIRVNHPLTYKGYTFYQSSYGPTEPVFTLGVRDRASGEVQSIRVGLEGTPVPLPNGDSFQVVNYTPNLQEWGPAIQVSLIKAGQPPSTFVVVQRYPQLDETRNGAQVFTLTDMQQGYYTGLQVTKDPGVWVVYLGCIVIVLGFYQCFFMSHRRMWVTVYAGGGKTTILTAGSTNKNRDIYAREFRQLVTLMKGGEHPSSDKGKG
ncbi:MAG: cytochrome c biogenesis protein ResB [Nitrospirota bacterium]|nr:cytochrome c biogenesis protein ResB [Nitrospirota bacterium]